MIKCPFCGAENKPESTNCVDCGGRVGVKNPPIKNGNVYFDADKPKDELNLSPALYEQQKKRNKNKKIGVTLVAIGALAAIGGLAQMILNGGTNVKIGEIATQDIITNVVSFGLFILIFALGINFIEKSKPSKKFVAAVICISLSSILIAGILYPFFLKNSRIDSDEKKSSKTTSETKYRSEPDVTNRKFLDDFKLYEEESGEKTLRYSGSFGESRRREIVEGFELYEDKLNRFKIQYPEEWTIEDVQGYDAAWYDYGSPNEEIPSCAYVMIKETEGLTINILKTQEYKDGLSKGVEAEVKNKSMNFAWVEDVNDKMVSGNYFLCSVYRVGVYDDEFLVYSALTVSNGSMFGLVFTSSPDKFDDGIAKLETMLSTLEF